MLNSPSNRTDYLAPHPIRTWFLFSLQPEQRLRSCLRQVTVLKFRQQQVFQLQLLSGDYIARLIHWFTVCIVTSDRVSDLIHQHFCASRLHNMSAHKCATVPSPTWLCIIISLTQFYTVRQAQRSRPVIFYYVIHRSCCGYYPSISTHTYLPAIDSYFAPSSCASSGIIT